jgi:hypothetical protein
MARPRELNLTHFTEVVVMMRKLGVASWVNSPVGDLHLGPEPPRAPKKEDADPKKARRSYYAELLGRPVTDAEVEMLP